MERDAELHDHDRGLSHDLPTLLSRRRALTALFAGAGAVALAGCAGDSTATGSAATSPAAAATTASGSASATATGTASAGTQIPEETAGPYPGDGSNGVNFEVYPSAAKATTASDKLRTSQLALPEDISTLVYATDGYSQSIQNLARSSLATDNVFSDGYSLQLATVTGTVAGGLTATLNVPV
jgi:hypothetical protein